MNSVGHLELEKKSVVAGTTYRYSSSWIHQLESADHWVLYWHQQKLMQGHLKAGDRILEIGVGSGFTANYLRSKGYDVTTIDIDEDKKPDICANIVSYEFPTAYDHVLAFEVFEHIPFEEFRKLIAQIRIACRNCLFLSVPRNEIIRARGSLKIQKRRERSFEWPALKGRITEAHHFWEIDHAGITNAVFESALRAGGFEVDHRQKVLSRYFYATHPVPPVTSVS